MRLSSAHLRGIFFWIALFSALALCGCGDWCFAGNINGSGGTSTGATIQSTCWDKQANGMVKATALKSPACNRCARPSDVEHVFVTLRGIQLHANTLNEPAGTDWVELSPELASQPRQIDLLGDASQDILLENVAVPAGYYREIRLQFFEKSPANPEEIPVENACGKTGWHCVLHADGTVEALRWPGDALELVIPLQNPHSNAMAVLPDSRTNLELSLKLDPVFLFSGATGLKVQNILVGHATATQPQALEDENPLPH